MSGVSPMIDQPASAGAPPGSVSQTRRAGSVSDRSARRCIVYANDRLLPRQRLIGRVILSVAADEQQRLTTLAYPEMPARFLQMYDRDTASMCRLTTIFAVWKNVLPLACLFGMAVCFCSGCGDDADPETARTSDAPRKNVAEDKRHPPRNTADAETTPHGDRRSKRSLTDRSPSSRSPSSNNGSPNSRKQDAGSKQRRLGLFEPSEPADGSSNADTSGGDGGSGSTHKPQPVYRPSDDRPQHDATELAKRGIHKFESKHLRLYTDIPAEEARQLPPLLDQAYKAWVEYFGELPPDREGSVFQVTGYLMADKPRFERAGLIPDDLPKFLNGRHRGYQFWMHEPEWEYYRRHLVVHEATHCFMYAIRDKHFPTWYMEGMAEYFGTHTMDADGTATFGVMPQSQKDFVGFGRIEYVQNDCRARNPLSLRNVFALKPEDYVHNQAYAWSWALCKFFDSHPRYQQRFRELGRILGARAFTQAMRKFILSEAPHIYSEWHLFAMGLDYGYDPVRAAIDIRPGKPLPADGTPKKTTVYSNRGWQSSGVWVDKDEFVEITAEGRFELAQQPKPWVSGPQGITFTYFQGRPLGELHAVIVPDSKKSLPITVRMLPKGPVGQLRRFRADIQGTIYLRLNDNFARLADNTGSVTTTLRRAADASP